MPETLPAWIQSIAVILAVAATIYLVIRQAKELEDIQRRLQRRVRRVTIVECGGKRSERPYRQGDYVGAAVECQDGSTGRITGIYTVDEERERLKKKERELLAKLFGRQGQR